MINYDNSGLDDLKAKKALRDEQKAASTEIQRIKAAELQARMQERNAAVHDPSVVPGICQRLAALFSKPQ